MRSEFVVPFGEDGISVTAIIPTYNRAQHLREAIVSVLGQTFPPAQVIVVNDGSKDNTSEVVAEFGSLIQYIAKANGGKSTALNLALRHATGNAIWIFDDDDIAESDALRRLADALRSNPECGLAYGDYDCFRTEDGSAVKKFFAGRPTPKPGNLFLHTLMDQSFIYQAGCLVRKACYDEVGAFDESFIRAQDCEMLIRLVHRYAGVKVEGITFHQRQHGGLRGSELSPVPADRVVETWLRYDQLVLSRLYRTHSLEDYLPFPRPAAGSILTEEQKFTALLQRSCIMARKGLWDRSAIDIRQAGEISRKINLKTLSGADKAILRRFFDLFSFGPHTFGASAGFLCALNEIRPAQLQRQMRAAIVWPLPLTIGAAVVNRQPANFWRFLRVYLQFATLVSVLRNLFDKEFLSAGLRLLREKLQLNGGHV